MTTLLAGPILRRATPNRVCVWFATREKTDLTLQIISKNGDVLGQSSQNDYCRLGENLFVYLLQARCNDPTLPYPVDTFLYYRLVETGTKLFLDLSKLTYDKSTPHPKFFIPGTLQQLLHGSCRKPHGGENCPDALSYGDSLLEATHNDLATRPAVLLLTGDQIYADDVSISVSAMLKEKATELIGRQETLPCRNTDGTITDQDPQNVPLHGRKHFLKKYKSCFSSDASENHLLSFGEFAAMYIYVFGNAENWQPADNWAALAQQTFDSTHDAKKAEQAFIEQQAAVKNFHSALAGVRRLLANVPTYMIFDDHDVTDDWNITNIWYDDVRCSPLGRRIVANALASYWAFQGWGNDPDNFDKDLQITIGQYLLDNSNTPEINERYDLHTWKHRGWGFSVPTNPPIIAIDSRTQRMPTSDSYLPVLLDRYALDWLRVEWAKLKTELTISSGTCPILIATTPILGFSALEGLQKIFYWLVNYLESYKYIKMLEGLISQKGYFTKKIIALADIESWTSNKQSFLTLMDCLSQDMQLKQCVFLSGDVHYSFSAMGKYIPAQGTDTLHCYQLVSSSLKNIPDDKQCRDIKIVERFSHSSTRHANKLKELFPWLPISSWESWVHLLESANSKTKERVHSECNLGLVKFADGKPTQHTLLNHQPIVFTLPDCTTFIMPND
ncbi:MAG: hypothetical protein ACXWE9_10215 [Methylobacter sp.]